MLAWVRWECAWRGCVYRADGGRGGEWQPHGAAHHDQRLQDCLSREGEGQSYSNKDKNQGGGAGQVFGFFWLRLVSFLLNVPVRWLFRLAHAGCSTLCAQTENGARQIFRGTGFSWLSSLLRFRFTLTSKGFHVGQEFWHILVASPDNELFLKTKIQAVKFSHEKDSNSHLIWKKKKNNRYFLLQISTPSCRKDYKLLLCLPKSFE